MQQGMHECTMGCGFTKCGHYDKLTCRMFVHGHLEHLQQSDLK
jgi:hypothetical protein